MIDLQPTDLQRTVLYKLVIDAVAPRPIAWVSSRDGDGRLNLAPFSYFTVASVSPLTLIFCPQSGRGAKDTQRNVEATGEFVVNLVTEALGPAMNITATEYPHGVSEFEEAGLTPVASKTVGVPRVGESPMGFECQLQQIVTVGTGAAVFGEVTHLWMEDTLWDAGNECLVRDALPLLGRAGGDWYVRMSDQFEMPRDRS